MDEREEEPKALVCSSCGERIDCCEFCDDEGCSAATCYGCVIVAIDQELPQPHAHGG